MNTENTQQREIQKVTWEQVEAGAQQIAKCIQDRIDAGQLEPISGIIAFSRGGLPLATMLAHALEIDVIYTVTEFNTYFLNGDADADHFLVVDDISDTGKTFSNFIYVPDSMEPQYNEFKFTTAALYIRPGTTFHPDFAMYNAGDKWVRFPWELKSVKA